MLDSNYINFSGKEADSPVYRVIPVHRLLEILKTRQLVLVSTRKWDDPFEQLIDWSFIRPQYPIAGRGAEADSKIAQFFEKARTIRESVYGQCWTELRRETDAMWRIYSPSKDGVKVKSTPRKLIEALRKSSDQYQKQCYVGRMQYKGQKALVAAIQKIDFSAPDRRGVAESLMYKRQEFRHEREVRLLYTAASDEPYSFAIDPAHVIEEIVFDPRMHNELYEAYRLASVRLGYKNRIKQSKLYQLPRSPPVIVLPR